MQHVIFEIDNIQFHTCATLRMYIYHHFVFLFPVSLYTIGDRQLIFLFRCPNSHTQKPESHQSYPLSFMCQFEKSNDRKATSTVYATICYFEIIGKKKECRTLLIKILVIIIEYIWNLCQFTVFWFYVLDTKTTTGKTLVLFIRP